MISMREVIDSHEAMQEETSNQILRKLGFKKGALDYIVECVNFSKN
jgi:DNA-directed RNA polymerase subunit H (RpoH/RPB5)